MMTDNKNETHQPHAAERDVSIAKRFATKSTSDDGLNRTAHSASPRHQLSQEFSSKPDRAGSLARRFALSVVPAASITAALVFCMNELITVDEIDLPEPERRVLTDITPMEVSEDVARTVRNRPKPIDAATTPPPPPRYKMGKHDIALDAPIIQGAVPKTLDTSKFEPITIGPVTMDDRKAQPIQPPILSYPDPMGRQGIQGTCDVRFDVSIDGRPYNVEPNCSHSGFEREAARAIGKVQFTPKIQRGQRVERKNVVYPIEFRMSDL
jgi:protein TonB